MALFVLHGFKWKRTPIRHHIILKDVEDAAPDYLMHDATPAALRESFTKLWPHLMKHLPDLDFIEQNDPLDETPLAAFQPYAFVASKVVKGDLNINLREAQAQLGLSPAAWDAFYALRDELTGNSEEEIGLYVVSNGKPELAGDQTTLKNGWKITHKVIRVSPSRTSRAKETQVEETQGDAKKGKASMLGRLIRKEPTKNKESSATTASARS